MPEIEPIHVQLAKIEMRLANLESGLDRLSGIKERVRIVEDKIADPRWSLERIQQSLIDHAIVKSPPDTSFNSPMRGIQANSQLEGILDSIKKEYVLKLEKEFQKKYKEAVDELNTRTAEIEKYYMTINESIARKMKEYELMP